MKVDLAEPLAPGKTATFDIVWHFLIPEHGADRMGRDGGLYELAQWYPRVAVYDRDGWRPYPLRPAGEFYGEFGDWDVTLVLRDDQVLDHIGADEVEAGCFEGGIVPKLHAAVIAAKRGVRAEIGRTLVTS